MADALLRLENLKTYFYTDAAVVRAVDDPGRQEDREQDGPAHHLITTIFLRASSFGPSASRN